MQWQLLVVFSMLILSLLALIVWLILKLVTNLNQSQKQNQDLLNRLMSKDVQTYQMMTASNLISQSQTSISDPYVSQTDAGELARLAEMAAVDGFGEPNYVDDVTEFFNDFGISAELGKDE